MHKPFVCRKFLRIEKLLTAKITNNSTDFGGQGNIRDCEARAIASSVNIFKKFFCEVNNHRIPGHIISKRIRKSDQARNSSLKPNKVSKA